MKKTYLLIALSLVVLNVNAQGLISQATKNDKDACGSHHLMEHRDAKMPGYLDASNQQLKQMAEAAGAKQKKEDNEVLEIQVVFHVVYNNEEENIPDSVFVNQMKILNESFMRTNADSADLRPIYKDIVGNPHINFTLATEDPQGNPTNGITRTSTAIEEFGGNMPYRRGQNEEILAWLNDTLYQNYSRISSTAKGGIDPWDTDRYLNVWVGDLRIFEPEFDNLREVFFLALATPPSSHPNFDVPGFDVILNTLDDGVYMHFPVPGPNNPVAIEAPFDVFNGLATEGKMLVHEVGHYLGLRHIWGDGDCSADDFIDDTPKCNNSSLYQCSKGKNTCVDDINGEDLPDMVENYMDYSGGNCMNSFTKDQIWVMREVAKRGRTSFVSIDEIEVANMFSVYPNPTNGLFTLDIRSATGNASYSIVDSQGRLVAQGDVVQNIVKINLDGAKGVYYVEVESDGLVQRKRIVQM